MVTVLTLPKFQLPMGKQLVRTIMMFLAMQALQVMLLCTMIIMLIAKD